MMLSRRLVSLPDNQVMILVMSCHNVANIFVHMLLNEWVTGFLLLFRLQA